MTTAVDVLALLLLLVVSVWVIGFGVMGATLAPRADVRPIVGFTAGAVGGPIGITWLWWRGRGSGAPSSAQADGGTPPTLSM